MDVLRDQLDLDKRAVVESNLILTESQAASFWPIYEEYQKELEAIDARLVKVVNEYEEKYVSGSITDAIARRLIGEAIALDEAEVALRRRTLMKLTAWFPRLKPRHLQVENDSRRRRFDLRTDPLVERPDRSYCLQRT
jgi:hypothetical protein